MMHVWLSIWHWLLAVTGTHIPPGQYSNWYNFWSGFGSDIGEVTIIGLIINWYRMHKCVSCFRLSKHDVQGTHYATCHKHLPDHDAIRAEHKRKFPLQHKILNK